MAFVLMKVILFQYLRDFGTIVYQSDCGVNTSNNLRIILLKNCNFRWQISSAPTKLGVSRIIHNSDYSFFVSKIKSI